MMSRKAIAVFVSVVMSTVPASYASKLPVRAATPTGCAAGGFDVVIEANREWGVVPFTAAFAVMATGSGDSIDAVYWSFGDDAPIQAVGAKVSHAFTEPTDYEVTARVVTSEHGILTRRITVAGHSAVMTLTFDDGHKTVLTEAMPLLRGYGVSATAYIVPSWTQIDPDAYMTWEDIDALQDAGWDIGSHSMTHHKLTEVDPADLDWEILQSREVLRSRGFAARSFSLPHEAYDENVMQVVRQHYESCKTDRGINPGIGDTDPHLVQSQTSLSWRPFSFYKAHIDSVLETGGWYVLNNHVVRDDCDGVDWCVKSAQLAEVMEYAQANRLKIASMQEVMDNRITGIPLGEDGIEAGLPAVTDMDEPALLEIIGFTPYISHAPAEIRYYVSAPGNVAARVYDVAGRQVLALLDRGHEAGEHALEWGGGNASGAPVASGHYFVVLTCGNGSRATARVTVVR